MGMPQHLFLFTGVDRRVYHCYHFHAIGPFPGTRFCSRNHTEGEGKKDLEDIKLPLGAEERCDKRQRRKKWEF